MSMSISIYLYLYIIHFLRDGARVLERRVEGLPALRGDAERAVPVAAAQHHGPSPPVAPGQEQTITVVSWRVGL